MAYNDQLWHNTPEAESTIMRVERDSQDNLWIFLDPKWVKQFRIEEGDEVQMSLQRVFRKD